MNRNLLWVGIGACGLVGHFLGGYVAKEEWVPQKRFKRFLTTMLFVSLIVVHLPMALLVRIASPFTTTIMLDMVKETMAANSSDDLDGKQLIVVNAPNPASFFYMPYAKAYEGKQLPRAIRVLAPAFSELEVTRIDDKTLKIWAKYGNLLTCKPDRWLDVDVVYMLEAISSVRSNGNGFHKADKVELPGMTAEIVELDDKSLPVAVIFEFDISLDDKSLAWVQWSWKKDKYFPFEVPKIGKKAKVSGPF